MAAKWMNKRAQALTEAVSKNVDRTEFDPEFTDLEKQTDATRLIVEKLVKTTPTYLHPNPAARAKLGVSSTYAKLTKTAADKRYPHAAGELAEVMTKGAVDFDSDNLFGRALAETGEALMACNESQHAFDAEVNQNFLEPMKMLLEKDIKEVMKHRKKLQGRRLDYDYKRRKQQGGKSSVTEADIRIAEQKLEESKGLSESGMINLLEADSEQVSQLAALADAAITYHSTCLEVMSQLANSLREIASESSSRPRREVRAPVAPVAYDDDDDDDDYLPAGDGPCARAVYDFDAENEGELSFKEGDTITLTSRLDENWLEGEVNGQAGIFPSNYVEVLRDL
eukprot:m.285930 g.285930  ORF g.285930 m.285930 type:complete len:339 (+) comp11478_c0_seq1:2692-3708(+)